MWLVTGGAGYIGSHMCELLARQSIDAIAFDNLSTGYISFTPKDTTFIEGDLTDTHHLDHLFNSFQIEGVIHFAGYKHAGQSVHKPVHTYQQNVVGTINLLSSMQKYEIQKMVFSSSASVYGTPKQETVTESSEKHPISPYGESKQIIEKLLEAQNKATGLQYTCFRYFNVAGTNHPHIRDMSLENLFPAITQKLLDKQNPQINGTDHETPDGTCVRDYVHVQDVVDAHWKAVELLTENKVLAPAYNLGSGTGYSVKQILEMFAKVSNIDFDLDIKLETQYETKMNRQAKQIIYTGEIDKYFDYQLGHLEYRSLRFEHTKRTTPNWQGNPVLNYPSKDIPWIRSIEHKHFNPAKETPYTITTREYSIAHTPETIPFYPIRTPKNQTLYKQYTQLAKETPNTHFKGRLGNYKYYDMDDTIEAALNFANQHKSVKQ